MYLNYKNSVIITCVEMTHVITLVFNFLNNILYSKTLSISTANLPCFYFRQNYCLLKISVVTYL